MGDYRFDFGFWLKEEETVRWMIAPHWSRLPTVFGDRNRPVFLAGGPATA
jgi:hypothetical protein